MKRTYNISLESIATVRRLVEDKQMAPSQDALVEYAISELARQVRDTEDALLWRQAATDPEFLREVAEIELLFPPEDIVSWE